MCIAQSSRRNCRGRGRVATWSYVEVLWNLFNFLEGGCPFSETDQVRLADRASSASWTQMHAEYAGFLHDQVHQFLRLRKPEPLGRGMAQLNELVMSIKNSQYKPGPYTVDELMTVAKHVEPERMSLPEIGGILDPVDHLKGHKKELFENMVEHVPHNDIPEKKVKGCLKIKPEHIVPVYEKLLDSHVAVLLPVSMALRDETGKIVSGGLFAVPHKEHTDRVICDRRPQNQLERRLVWAKLPHGALLTQIIVPPGHTIRGSGDDLSNYFYLLKHRESWLHRNAIGSPVSGKDFLKYGCDPKTKYVLCFRVIPMGDTNAVDIAQETHLQVLQDAGCMQSSEVIAYRDLLPASHCWEGLYIDDHIVMQVLPKKKLRNPKQTFRDDEILLASRQQYEHLGIPTSDKKAFTHQPSFTAWGTHVEGSTGRVGTPREKLVQLSELIVQVCSLKKVSKKLLQKTLGLLVHPSMHQRLLMSLLQEVYLWVEKLDDSEARRLPAAAREELLMFALCLPLCHSNIKWQVSPRVGASDACLDGGGRAATLTDQSIAETLYRYSEHKGEHVRLDWEKGRLAPPSDMVSAPQELEDLMAAHVWNTTQKIKFGHKQHINILELKMIKEELKDLVKQTTAPMRAVNLVDSRVAAGAFARGRSSSKQLNRILRSMIGWSLCGRKSLHLVWVRSERNPSDHPSRACRIPEPKNDETIRRIFGAPRPELQTRKSNRKILKQAVNFVSRDGAPSSESKKAGPNHPAMSQWTFREIFAGCGRLSKTFLHADCFNVGSPLELIQKGRESPEHDLLNDDTFHKLCADAAKPRQIWHFGLPCNSFSLMQNMNHGTRTSDHPEGAGTLAREIRGNELARRTFLLCTILHASGNFFTIENPKTSYVWKLDALCELVRKTSAVRVSFDQCEYGLKIPLNDTCIGLAKKPTTIVGTLPGLLCLQRSCSGHHDHVHVIGGVKTAQGWKKRSTLAGAYPPRLCQTYHKCCIRMFA